MSLPGRLVPCSGRMQSGGGWPTTVSVMKGVGDQDRGADGAGGTRWFDMERRPGSAVRRSAWRRTREVEETIFMTAQRAMQRVGII